MFRGAGLLCNWGEKELRGKKLRKKNAEEIDSLQALFLKWTDSRMKKETIKKVEQFWLEPVTSFSVENSQE